MSWLLEEISIEGFRGVNNEGAPLELKFHTEKVNSVFAPNGVGKSSIFEAVTYALTGEIPKLEKLQAAERPGAYYLNRFHSSNVGTIGLTLKQAGGGASVVVTVQRDNTGGRTVTTSDGSDGEALLQSLNREFVLLDADTFRTFIDDTPLNRGRSFAGLLGLGSYSALRQALQTISNTRAFNNHFGVSTRNGQTVRARSQIQQARAAVAEAYTALTGEAFDPTTTKDVLCAKAHSALYNIPVITSKCEGKSFEEISADDCLVPVREAEGGPEREKLGQLIRSETVWQDAIAAIPTPDGVERVVQLVKERDAALEQTQGDIFLRLYRLTEQITENDEWADKRICPACDRSGDTSVLDHAKAKVALYDAVTAVSGKLVEEWNVNDWDKIASIETDLLDQAESPLVKSSAAKIVAGRANAAIAVALEERLNEIRKRAEAKLAAITDEKDELEKKLLPSLVAVTEKVEAGRRLQGALQREASARGDLASMEEESHRVERVRKFLMDACTMFSGAESAAASRRLQAVEPLCREIFRHIIFEPVVPAIAKREGSEDLSISLAEFHSLSDLSAQSVLPESYRNAFAISVYLAAASLFGGSAKFLLLDDITSSLDAGHQFHLMEVLRTRFSRPNVPNGPQVIILSHDTLLEKYFNVNGSTIGWSHQRIEGTPRTAVLPQSNAVNRIRDATLDLLNVGNAQDAAPRIRQYLEYVLEDIIVRCRIPVPMDVAMHDDRHLASHLIGAIDAAVKLHAAAQTLVLDQTQVQGMNLAATTITANFLAHWSTGQVQAFSAGALLGIMQAIDNYCGCFKFEPTPGAPKQFYRSLSQRT